MEGLEVETFVEDDGAAADRAVLVLRHHVQFLVLCNMTEIEYEILELYVPAIISSMSSSVMPCLLLRIFLNWSSSICPVLCGSNSLSTSVSVSSSGSILRLMEISRRYSLKLTEKPVRSTVTPAAMALACRNMN